MSKIRKKAGVRAVQPVRPPFDPMTPPVKKKKSGSQRGAAEEYNTIAQAGGMPGMMG